MSAPNKARFLKLAPASVLLLVLLLVSGCSSPEVEHFPLVIPEKVETEPRKFYAIEKEVLLKDYFSFMATVIPVLETMVPYPLDEHLLVRYNSWIIDTLANTDYYLQKERGTVVKDAGNMTILNTGDTLYLPDEQAYQTALHQRDQVIIDVNIPEFRLRIILADSTLASFPVRVGQNRAKYLAMAGRTVDLRTHPGTGTITRINRKPAFINPKDNHVYTSTRRDDGFRTALPLVPWLEPTLDGQRYGQLVHPTTNPTTLGKAYSNGCVGLGEGDMWRVYYYAPLDTKVNFRYELEVTDADGKNIRLPDIYPGYSHRKPLAFAQLFSPEEPIFLGVCDCR